MMKKNRKTIWAMRRVILKCEDGKPQGLPILPLEGEQSVCAPEDGGRSCPPCFIIGSREG